MTAYLDCNATTPVEPAVAEAMLRWTVEEFGNAGSRTHEYGARAKRQVAAARAQVAAVVDADPGDVIFTSGATEANNLALLGLEAWAVGAGKTHLISTQIEHKSVLAPLERLAGRGFEVDLVPPNDRGVVPADAVLERVRPDTAVVSLMHINNETGVIQPVAELAEALAPSESLLHVDAAQGFGKVLEPLRHPRIDMLSLSGHKIFGPKGIGALITRRRAGSRPPLEPLVVGGGQERGLRAGTVPVGLCAALGVASELAIADAAARRVAWEAIRSEALAALGRLGAEFNGGVEDTATTTLNVSVPGLDNEAAIVALKGVAAVSNGSACTSHTYEPSHVLAAMGLPQERAAGALRLSWSHLGERPDWGAIEAALRPFMPAASNNLAA